MTHSESVREASSVQQFEHKVKWELQQFVGILHKNVVLLSILFAFGVAWDGLNLKNMMGFNKNMNFIVQNHV